MGFTRCVWKVTGLCTLHEQLLSQRKSIAFCDVTMSYNFKNQISAFFLDVTTTFFFSIFFCQDTFFVTILWKFDRIKNFRLFFSLMRRMSVKQQIKLKFLVHVGKTPTEALKLLQQVYGDDMMSRTRLFEWHWRFKEGREEVEDDHRSGRPSTSRTD